MKSREKGLEEALKDEDEFLNFEFDDLSEEDSPQKADLSPSEEEVIELVDIIEEDEIILDSQSGDVVQFLDAEPVKDSDLKKEIVLEQQSEGEDLALEFLENPDGVEIPLGVEEKRPADGELEGLLVDDETDNLEIDLDSALKDLEGTGEGEPQTGETEEDAEEFAELDDLEAFGTLDELDLTTEEEFEFEEKEASASEVSVEDDYPIHATTSDVEETGPVSPPEQMETVGEEETIEEFSFELEEVTETRADFEGPEEQAEGELSSVSDGPARENTLTELPVGNLVVNEEGADQGVPPRSELPAGISEEKLEMIVTRVVQEVVERVARETMASVAEKVLGEAIEALKQSLDSSSE